MEIVKRSDKERGFKVLPKSWIVEPTFGWLGHLQRLSQDYEYFLERSESMIHIAMIQIRLKQLA